MAAAVAGCSRAIPPLLPHSFDPKILDKGFPALAARALPGVFNAAVMEVRTATTWYGDADKPFPLGGAAVLPIAATLLDQIDAGKIALGEKVTVRDVDLSPPYSLIGESWRATPASFAMNITVMDLLSLAVEYGDNTAADVLLGRIGGPGAVVAWLAEKDITGMRLDRYARETGVQVSGLESFRPAWRTAKGFGEALELTPVTVRQRAMESFLADNRDTTSAQGAMSFLYKLSHGQLASKASSDLLLKMMTPTRAVEGPMGAAWPPSAAWAHKAGEPRSDLGFTPVQNDMGLVTLKDGRRFAVAALLAGSTASAAQRAKLFSDTAKLMLDAMGG